MRWDDLFADLEAQAEALAAAERSAEIDERTRIEVGAIGLADRLWAATGSSVRVSVAGGLALTGALTRVGGDWLLLDEGAGRECVVALPAIVSVAGLSRAAAAPDAGGALRARLRLPHVLRGIARDRLPCRVHLVDGTTHDATIDRVGADFVDLAGHAPGEARRRDAVRGSTAVALAAIAAVRRGA